VIESHGRLRAVPVAETFTFTDDQGRSLSEIAQLDTMVTVVDARNFLRDFHSTQDLQDRNQGINEADEHTIVDLLTDQVEFANVILISKTDAVTPDELAQVRGIIKALNPKARVQETRPFPGGPRHSAGHRLVSASRRRSRARAGSTRSKATRRRQEYGVSSFVFRSHPPLASRRDPRPSRSSRWPGAIRAKASVLAGHANGTGGLRQPVRRHAHHPRHGVLLERGSSRTSMAVDEASREEILSNWQEPHGDRRQEIVIIGRYVEARGLASGLPRLPADPEGNERRPRSLGIAS